MSTAALPCCGRARAITTLAAAATRSLMLYRTELLGCFFFSASSVPAADQVLLTSKHRVAQSISADVSTDAAERETEEGKAMGVGGKGACRLLGPRPGRACPGVSINVCHSPLARAISPANSVSPMSPNGC